MVLFLPDLVFSNSCFLFQMYRSQRVGGSFTILDRAPSLMSIACCVGAAGFGSLPPVQLKGCKNRNTSIYRIAEIRGLLPWHRNSVRLGTHRIQWQPNKLPRASEVNDSRIQMLNAGLSRYNTISTDHRHAAAELFDGIRCGDLCAALVRQISYITSLPLWAVPFVSVPRDYKMINTRGWSCISRLMVPTGRLRVTSYLIVIIFATMSATTASYG